MVKQETYINPVQERIHELISHVRPDRMRENDTVTRLALLLYILDRSLVRWTKEIDLESYGDPFAKAVNKDLIS